MSSADRTGTETFGSKNSDERFARTIIRRCERHRLIVGIGKQLSRSGMTFAGIDYGQRMLATHLYSLQSPVREHLIDDVSQRSHRISQL